MLTTCSELQSPSSPISSILCNLGHQHDLIHHLNLHPPSLPPPPNSGPLVLMKIQPPSSSSTCQESSLFPEAVCEEPPLISWGMHARISMRACVRACMGRACARIRVCVYARGCTSVCVYVCMYVYMHACMHACMYARVCAYVYVCVRPFLISWYALFQPQFLLLQAWIGSEVRYTPSLRQRYLEQNESITVHYIHD